MAGQLPMYLYVPNVIDYVRLVLCIGCFWVRHSNPAVFILMYSLGNLLDYFDGPVARYLNQTSKFGSTLDVLTDRIANLGLFIVLIELYPFYSNWLWLHLSLDCLSLFMFLVASAGVSSEGFKLVLSRNDRFLEFCLREPFLTIRCISYELFFMSFYVDYYYGDLHNVLSVIIVFCAYAPCMRIISNFKKFPISYRLFVMIESKNK